MASATPSTKERISAPMTRASVTSTSMGVILTRLAQILAKPGIANAGMPSAGAKYESVCQSTQKTAMETSVWRGNPAVSSAARTSSWDINDLLVRHLLVEAGLHGALHHVGDGFTHRR